MDKDYTLGDMLIAIGKHKAFNDTVCQMFLYLISEIMESPDEDTQKAHWTINDIVSKLAISTETYNDSIKFLLHRKLINHTITEDGKECLYLNQNTKEWQLDSF